MTAFGRNDDAGPALSHALDKYRLFEINVFEYKQNIGRARAREMDIEYTRLRRARNEERKKANKKIVD